MECKVKCLVCGTEAPCKPDYDRDLIFYGRNVLVAMKFGYDTNPLRETIRNGIMTSMKRLLGFLGIIMFLSAKKAIKVEKVDKYFCVGEKSSVN